MLSGALLFLLAAILSRSAQKWVSFEGALDPGSSRRGLPNPSDLRQPRTNECSDLIQVRLPEAFTGGSSAGGFWGAAALPP